MSNSSLISHTRISPNKNTPRTAKIDTITIHCMAGNMTIESCGEWFSKSTTQASSNYGIGSDGRIGLYVNESDRSWCSSNGSNDHRAVTIEVANDKQGDPWTVSDKAYASLINLCEDICRRNGIKQLLWKGDKSLVGKVDQQNMTVHRWFANKSCPGDYLYNLHSDICKQVNARLNPAPQPAQDKEIEYKGKKFINFKDYQIDSMKWAVDKGFINGDEKGQIFMDENITKGDLAVILKNLSK